MIIKLESKPAADAAEALGPHAAAIYAKPGTRRLIIGELKHVSRTEVAPEEEAQPEVKMRIVAMEVANTDQEDTVRQAMRALRLHRTAYGTLTEEGDVEMAASTLEETAGRLSDIEAARLHILIGRWTEYGRRVLGQPKATREEIRREMHTLLSALEVGIGQSPIST